MDDEVTRWDLCCSEMLHRDDGDFVEYEDYLRLQDKVERMEDALMWFRSEIHEDIYLDIEEAHAVIDQALGED